MLVESCKLFVQTFCSLAVSRIGFFRRIVQAEVYFTPFIYDSGYPLVSMFFNSFVRLTAVGFLFSVSHILGMRGFPEILPVVFLLSVFMVYLFFRPSSSNVFPRKAVCGITSAVNANKYSTVLISLTCDTSFFSARRKSDFPPEKSSALVVTENLSEVRGRQRVARGDEVCFAGVAHSILLRSGRSEAGLSASNALLPRFSSTGVV